MAGMDFANMLATLDKDKADGLKEVMINFMKSSQGSTAATAGSSSGSPTEQTNSSTGVLSSPPAKSPPSKLRKKTDDSNGDWERGRNNESDALFFSIMYCMKIMYVFLLLHSMKLK